jgi:DNA polymerase I
LIVIEHDPLLYEDAQGMIEYVSKGFHDAAKEAAVLLYSPAKDTFLEYITRDAGRVFYFDYGPKAAAKLIRKLIQKRRRARPP